MLASFYSNLEALVYDEEVDEAVDMTKPPCEDQDKKLLEFVDAITEEFGEVIVLVYIFVRDLLFISKTKLYIAGSSG